MKKTRNRLSHFVARHLPDRVKYWATITVGAYATTGKYGNTVTPELRLTDALQRFQIDKDL